MFGLQHWFETLIKISSIQYLKSRIKNLASCMASSIRVNCAVVQIIKLARGSSVGVDTRDFESVTFTSLNCLLTGYRAFTFEHHHHTMHIRYHQHTSIYKCTPQNPYNSSSFQEKLIRIDWDLVRNGYAMVLPPLDHSLIPYNIPCMCSASSIQTQHY